MTGNSQVPKDVLLDNLRQLAPEVFTEGKVDWERLKATLGEEVEFSNERYVLNWAGKSDAFRVLQTPSTRTLAPAKEESADFETTGNIFIEGENLEVLKILQKSYFGKIKMIYIDPPYNTGNDAFIYPDKFSETKDEYQKRVGDKDEEGYMTREGLFRKNSRENGQYHSNWLNMMYPRLFLARNLLRDDGVIFVSIDDNEVHNLRLMMNEIFGEENFLAQYVWQSKKGGGSDSNTVVQDHEYVLSYSKNLVFVKPGQILLDAEPLDKKDEKGKYRRGRELNKWGSNSRRIDRPTMWFPIPGPNNEDVFPIKNDGTEGCWRFGRNKMMEFVKKGDVEFAKREDGTFTVYEKIRKEENRNKPYRTFLKEVNATSEGSLMVKEIFNGTSVFSFPKPPSLIKMLIKIGNVENSDIVLDFFAGSGSTAHAVLELNKEDSWNRKFISVQLPEKTEEKTEAFQAGYTTIADIAKERIKRVIQKIKEGKHGKLDFSPQEKQDLGFKVFKLSESNFKIWRSRGIETAEEIEKQMALFTDPVSENAAAEPMVYELMLKSGFDLNSPVEHQNGVYRIGNGEMALLIETVSEELIGEVIQSQPQKVIALDRLFEGNDQLKTNTALQMKDANIDFKTI